MTPGDWVASLPRKLVGAGALITDADGRFLLVEPTYKDHWEIPGGLVEAGESPRAGVQRELFEELGFAVPLGDLLVIDWSAAKPDRPDGVMLVFDGGVLTAAQAARITLPADELRSWCWCTEPEAAERLTGRLARRIASAARARAAGTTLYLENGEPAAS